jgi:hypothetical protein
MRDNITSARDAAQHLAWFDPNNVYWQIRFEASAGGIPNRIIVCYKEAAPIADPLRGTNLETVQWRQAPVNQPENALLGIMYESLFDYGAGAAWVVSDPSHWVYAGTGLFNGSQIPGLVGYEYDRVRSNGLTPAGMTVLASSPVPTTSRGRWTPTRTRTTV